jgi:hypothetical protein
MVAALNTKVLTSEVLNYCSLINRRRCTDSEMVSVAPKEAMHSPHWEEHSRPGRPGSGLLFLLSPSRGHFCWLWPFPLSGQVQCCQDGSTAVPATATTRSEQPQAHRKWTPWEWCFVYLELFLKVATFYFMQISEKVISVLDLYTVYVVRLIKRMAWGMFPYSWHANDA